MKSKLHPHTIHSYLTLLYSDYHLRVLFAQDSNGLGVIRRSKETQIYYSRELLKMCSALLMFSRHFSYILKQVNKEVRLHVPYKNKFFYSRVQI